MNTSKYTAKCGAMHQCGEIRRPGRQLSRLFPVLLAAYAAAAWAAEGDTFQPLVQYSFTHEDNLFRLSNALPSALLTFFAPEGKSDNYQTLGAGMNVDWKQGRQQVLVNALISHTKFDKYSVLDYDGKNLSAEWKWALGNHLNGRLGTTYTTYLGSFQDVTGLVSNVRTNRNTFFSAAYQFHPRWSTELKANHQSLDYSNSSLTTFNNYTEDHLDLALYYQGGEVNRTGVELSKLKGNYPNRPGGDSLATDYDGTAVRLVMNWGVTGKSRLHGRVGYLTQNYNHSGVQNFSGLNGRLDWDWTPTGKTLVNLAAYRELYNSELVGANHEEVTGTSAQAQWQVLPKVALGAMFSYDNNKYSGTTLDENIRTAGLNATYKPWSGGNLTLSVQNQRRGSNLNLREFDATVLNLSALLQF